MTPESAPRHAMPSAGAPRHPTPAEDAHKHTRGRTITAVESPSVRSFLNAHATTRHVLQLLPSALLAVALLGVWEVSIAKMRVFRLPDFLGVAFVFAFIAILLAYLSGGDIG